jgi:ribA/ribD-fused uncharacterized protein
MNYTVDWLKLKFDNGERIKFIFFWGRTQRSEEVGDFIFSQWYNAPFLVDNIEYKTSEHWMMAHKAKLFNDIELFDRIIQSNKPGEAKELGRQIRNFDAADWDDKKYEIVKKGNIHKFTQHKKLRDFLINTGERVLAEASPIDSIWGIGLDSNSNGIENPYMWQGLNLLGFALMEVRDILRLPKK